MDKFNNIFPTILKKKTIQKVKTLLIKLSLFNSEENNTPLKTDLLNFLNDKQNSEEEIHIKATIAIIFQEELIKLGILKDNSNQKEISKKEKQKSQSPEEKESIEKNKQETQNINIPKNKKNKKKLSQNERLNEIIKKIENDGSLKNHLINKIKQLNTNIFSYFQFDIDRLNELNELSKEKLLTIFFENEYKFF